MKAILLIVFGLFYIQLFAQKVTGLKLADIPIRDPYILPVDEEKTYYLYAATREETKTKSGNQGFVPTKAPI
jgi:hypothetical protein